MQRMNRGRKSEFAIASLIVGILSFVPLGLANLGCAILAIILGILALKRIAAADSNERGEGLAAAGIVIGVICIIMIIIVAIFIAKNPQLLEQILKRPLPK